MSTRCHRNGLIAVILTYSCDDVTTKVVARWHRTGLTMATAGRGSDGSIISWVASQARRKAIASAFLCAGDEGQRSLAEEWMLDPHHEK